MPAGGYEFFLLVFNLSKTNVSRGKNALTF